MTTENRIFDWGEDTAAIIVNICLDVNALKLLCRERHTTDMTRIFRCDEDIGKSLDRLLGAGNRKEFKDCLEISKKQVEEIIRIGTSGQLHFPEMYPIKNCLEQLHTRLNLLEEKINSD
ncbi:hypothetical protein [Sinomicrobium sp. M5D2P9]